VSISDAEIVRLYADGLSMAQIAEKGDIGKATVWRKLHKAGVESRKDNAPHDEQEISRYWAENGENLYATAKHFGVSKHTVRRALKRAGVYRPTPSYFAKDSLSTHHKSRDAEFRKNVMNLVNTGVSKLEICRQLGTTEETIRHVIYLDQNHINTEVTEPCQHERRAQQKSLKPKTSSKTSPDPVTTSDSATSSLSTHADTSHESPALIT